jgi:hypothetical protein
MTDKEAILHPAPHPDQLNHPRFVFEALHPKHVELDYQAVMDTRVFLRKWSRSTWPTDDFTIEANYSDLDWHYDEHIKGIAYTYTILNPARDKCLGCIYINPADRIKTLSEVEIEKTKNLSAVVTFWVIQALMASPQEDLILSALINWLKTDWQFPNLMFSQSDAALHQRDLFAKNGLEFYLSLSTHTRYQNLWKVN